MRPLTRLLCAAALLPLFAIAGDASAQVSDSAVKAAFLPRFARYVEWPPGAAPSGSSGVSLCIIGDDPFGPLVDSAARSQLVVGHRVVVRRIGSPGSGGACHIAFIGDTRNLAAAQVLAGFSNRPVLTVTDAANGGPRGIIHFQVVNGRVRFAIDTIAARRKGLGISSRLLALATDVRQ